MNTDYFKGIIPPIVTPIDENENVNEKALRKLIDYEIDGGVIGENMKEIADAGATVMVSGNYIFGASDPAAVIAKFKAL